MTDSQFWESGDHHVAVNPHRPEDAGGLLEWARSFSDEPLCFFQTSGSEGLAKWVALSKEAFLLSGREVNKHLQVTQQDRWLIALPLHHVGGFSILARAHLSGSSWRLEQGRWHPERFTECCEAERITLVSLVPTQVHDLVREGLKAPRSLRAVVVGAGGMSPELAAKARGLGWPVLQSYGMTEAASQIATQSLDGPCKPGVMQVLPHWKVRLDAEGRLVLRGPALAKGYVLRSEGEGWLWHSIGSELITRDHVRLWTEVGGRSWLEFVGRESGFVKILGELVHLAPLRMKLEELALRHQISPSPWISAVPDERRGARLLLVVENEKSHQLKDAFNAVTEPLCHVSEVVHLPAIPRSSLGKVQEGALADLLTSYRLRN